MSLPVVSRAARIQLLLLDVDGVLTDGGITYTDDGQEIKRFHVRDGAGLKAWQRAGHQLAIVSGRRSRAVERRAAELGITLLYQGQAEKRPAFEEILATTGLAADRVAAIGDDLPDLPILRRAGLALAVADACPEARDIADHVTVLPGGAGAVREAVEWLLRLQGKWATILEEYQS